MRAPLARRTFVAASAAATGLVFLRSRHSRAAALPVEILETKVISQDGRFYNGWPTVCRRANGQLMVTYSGGREGHVCPFGRVEMMTSDDEGRSWSYPRVLLDGPIDDRDSGVVETAKGTLLVTTFTSLAYEPLLAAAKQGGKWEQERLSRWNAANSRLSAEMRQKELGVWMIRSTDGGLTWSPKYESLVNSPHGPIQLADGRLLYAGKDLWRAGAASVCVTSTDDGLTWRGLAEIKRGTATK